MKKVSIIIVALFISLAAMAQSSAKKVEVLYFKASLSCCQAKACNNLEIIAKEIIAKNFSTDKVVFKTVIISDSANNELVKKYNAKSQTFIIVKNKKYIDLSNALAKFARDNDKEAFEKTIVSQIKTFIK